MVHLETIGFFIELLSLLLFFVVLYYVYRIDITSKGFENIWLFVALGFSLIIVRRILGLILPYLFYLKIVILIEYIIIPIILLITSIVFIIGFYKFNKMCHDTLDHNKKK